MRTSFLSFIYSVLLLLFFISCEEEQTSLEDDGNVTLRVTALLPDAAVTRTTYTSQGAAAGVKVEWEQNDGLILYGLDSKQGYKFSYSQEEKYGSHWTYTDASYQEGENLIGIYPASMVNGTTAICNFSGQDGTLENLKKYDLMISKESLLSQNKVDLQFSHINTFLRLLVPKTTLPDKSGVSIVLFGDSNSKNSSISLNITDTNQITRSGSESIEIICTASPEEEEQYYCYYAALPSAINVNQIELRKEGVALLSKKFNSFNLNGGYIFQTSLVGSNNTILKCDNLSSLLPANTKKIIFEVNSPASSGTIVSEYGDYPAFLNVSNDVATISTLSSTLYASQSCESMFYGLRNLETIESLHLLNTSRVRNMSTMFDTCNSLKEIDLSNFDTHMVENMYHMFIDCQSLTTLDLTSFDTRRVYEMSGMFSKCSSLASINLTSFNTENVHKMQTMFGECSSLRSVDLSSFNTTRVESLFHFFYGCSSLSSIDLSGFDTRSVNNMSGTFAFCSSLENIDLSNFNTSNVETMSSMFSGCSSLTSVVLSNFDVRKVTDMNYMFLGCSQLTNLDLSGFNTMSLTKTSDMFYECVMLKKIDMSVFKVGKIVELDSMFGSVASESGSCTIVCTPQAKTKFSSSSKFPTSRIKWIDSTTGQSM